MPGNGGNEEKSPPSSTLRGLADELRDINEHLLISSLREQESAEAAEQKTAQLSALLEALSEGVVIADASGRILMLNQAARRIMGIEPAAAAVAAAVLDTMDQVNSLDVR